MILELIAECVAELNRRADENDALRVLTEEIECALDDANDDLRDAYDRNDELLARNETLAEFNNRLRDQLRTQEVTLNDIYLLVTQS